MVGRVLTGNGITRYGDGPYTMIGAEELSVSERDDLQQLCRQRLGEIPGAHKGTRGRCE